MLETHIMMSLLIFHLIFLLVLHLVILMDLTITHMSLVHERVALCLDALDYFLSFYVGEGRRPEE
jgi:hypothetical protein